MGSDNITELTQFQQFVTRQIENGGRDMSPEECVDLWRADHPEPDDLADSVAAIMTALGESARGEGRPADEVVAELRAELKLPDVGNEP